MSIRNINLTQAQTEIMEYAPLDLVVTAPAGCGKTEALAFRVAGLISRFDFKNNDRKVLVVTFTNRATENIKDRLFTILGRKCVDDKVTVLNFHMLARRIIKAHGKSIGIDDEWTMVGADWVSKALDSLPRRDQPDVREALSRAKREGVTDAEVRSLLKKYGSAVEKGALAVEKQRLVERVIPYDDQIRLALWILDNPDIAQLYRNHFFAGVVDEFQDLTEPQLRLVKAVCGDAVTYAGDTAQGIYSFAGASADSVYADITSSGTKVIELSTSFRSSPVVLDMINSLRSLTGGVGLAWIFRPT